MKNLWRFSIAMWVSASTLLGLTAKAAPPPVVGKIVINGGESQRSKVTRIDLTFTADVGASLQAGDLHLLNLNTKTQITGAKLNYSKVKKTGTWKFPSQLGKSLPDGNYSIYILSTDVTDAGGQHLVPNTDSTAWSSTLFRYFGDFDGDRDVDALDTAKFRKIYLKAQKSKSFQDIADVDGNKRINKADLAAFQEHYRTVLAQVSSAPTITEVPKTTGKSMEPSFRRLEKYKCRPADRNLRRRVKQERGSACEACHDSLPLEQLCVHHIFETRVYPELAREISNMIVLCFKCHSLVTNSEGLGGSFTLRFYAGLPLELRHRHLPFLKARPGTSEQLISAFQNGDELYWRGEAIDDYTG